MDIRSLVGPEWACLVALEWACGAVTGMIISTMTTIISTTTDIMMSFLLVPSAFHGGGVGAGVRGGAGAATRTGTMVPATHMVPPMGMAMAMAVVLE